MIDRPAPGRAASRATGVLVLAGLAPVGAACDLLGPGPGDGPDAEPVVVGIDAGHHNHHTAEGSYAPFARVLRDDGHEVRTVTGEFRPDRLARLDVLVIANALHPSNVTDWALPTPSAFTDAEIEAVADWVAAGGGLLLIADHMPFPGAAARLAAAFGVTMTNGFAFDTDLLDRPKPCLLTNEVDLFRRGDGSLAGHPITDGTGAADRIDSIATFTGHAFQAPGAEPLLRLGPGWRSLLPERAWVFTDDTPDIDAAGWLQGAVLRHGAGRVAIFGEAGMFSEQTCGDGIPHGMNAPAAAQNARFVLNTVRWLADR